MVIRTKLEDHVQNLKSSLEVRIGIHKVIQAVDNGGTSNNILTNDLADLVPTGNQAADDDQKLPGGVTQGRNGLEEKKHENNKVIQPPFPALIMETIVYTNTSKDWVVPQP